nr:hypothetical protein [Tanacetum cinerariifolium]
MSYDWVFCRPCTCERCRRHYTDRFCAICCVESENAFIDDLITNSFDDLPNSSDHPPQHQTHCFESNGDPPQIPFSSNPDFDNFLQTLPNFQQQFLCCENYGCPHETFQCQPMNQNFYNSNSLGFDQIQPSQYYVMHQPPEESVKEFKEQLKTAVLTALEGVIQPPPETSVEILQAKENLMKYILTFLKNFNRISFRETPKVLSLTWENFFEIQHAFREEDIQELLRKLLEDLQIIREELEEYINSLSWNSPTFYDDDDEYTIQYKEYLENLSNAITPDLPTEEPDNSLSMRDEHLSIIPKTESDELKSSVKNLILIPSESKGIFDYTCDVPFCDNSPPLDVLNDHFEIFSDVHDDCTSNDDDSFEDIDYVEASPPNSELVSLEEVEDDILREKLLNINLLIPKIEASNDNPTPSSLSYFDNSLPEFETFSDHIEETRSGSTTTHFDYSLSDYKAFCFVDDHIEEKSSGSTTTHFGFSFPVYDSFIFDLSIDLFPPVDRSVSHHEEFTDELTHIISSLEYDYFEIEPDQGELTSVVMEDILGETHVHVPNVLPTHPALMLDSDFMPSDDSFGSDLEVSFSSRTRNKIFDLGIFFEVQSK